MYVLKYIYLYYVTKINNDSLQKQYVRIVHNKLPPNKNIISYKINFEYSNLIEARPNDYQGFILAYRQRKTRFNVLECYLKM